MPEFHAPTVIAPPPHPRLATRLANAAGRCARGLVLRAHALAERLDLVPPEFDADQALDRTDARAVAGEWLHQLKRRMALYPEEALAWKVGLTALSALLVGLAVAVRSLS
jgi:hypothetical protein